MSVTATAYTYDELTEDAQKTAIEKCRTATTEDFEWWRDDYDYWKEKLAKLGYEVEDIWFSGFWSQGDGACFEGSLNVLEWLEATDGEKQDASTRSLRYWLKRLDPAAAYVNIGHRGNYCHKFTMYVEVEWAEWPEPPKAGEQLLALEPAILDHARDMAQKIYDGLQETCEGMMKDDYIADHLQINEYLFWKNGHPAHFS